MTKLVPMMRFINRTLMAFTLMLATVIICTAQPNNPDSPEPVKAEKKEIRPFKVLTSGKQITIKSSKEMRSIMVWTASGHRILEEKDVKLSSYTFRINNNISEKIFFLMVQFTNGKVYTEKLGLR
jgi:hypothetical protein